MALFIAIVLPLALFAALAIAAELWGVDSRPNLGDDHARQETPDHMHHPTTEFLPMNAIAPYVAAIHLQNLLEEADSARRARLASGQPSVPAWRRGLGGILAFAARSVDPSINERSSNGRGARAMAA